MSYANSRITTHDGDVHSCCEWPREVLKIKAAAEATGSLMELERPIIPAGQKLYLDPSQITSIRGDR